MTSNIDNKMSAARTLTCMLLCLVILSSFFPIAFSEVSEKKETMYLYAYEKIIGEIGKKIEASKKMYYEVCDRNSNNWLEMYLYYTSQADLFEQWFGIKILPFSDESTNRIKEIEFSEELKETIIAALNIGSRDEFIICFPYETLKETEDLFLQNEYSPIMYYYAGRIAAEIYADIPLAYSLMEKAERASFEQNDYDFTVKILEDMASLLLNGAVFLSVSDLCSNSDPMLGVYPSLELVNEHNIDKIKTIADIYNNVWKPSLFAFDKTNIIPHGYRENYLDISLQVVYYYCLLGDNDTSRYYLNQLKNRLSRVDFNAWNLEGYRLDISAFEVIISNGDKKNKYELERQLYDETVSFNESIGKNLSYIEAMFP